jgi:hypothetical protein
MGIPERKQPPPNLREGLDAFTPSVHGAKKAKGAVEWGVSRVTHLNGEGGPLRLDSQNVRKKIARMDPKVFESIL